MRPFSPRGGNSASRCGSNPSRTSADRALLRGTLQVIPGPSSPPERWSRNRQHWDSTLDARNLRESAAAASVERELRLYETPDVRAAFEALRPLDGRVVLDLGGGLGLMAILLAREGAVAVVADVSPRRLRAARELARRAGVEGRVHFVLAEAEALPFRTGSLDRQTTKSVLIHTRLAPAAEELARTLCPRSGRAVFLEPMDRNPFANAYRRLFAPAIWRDITDYFTPERFGVVRAAFRARGLGSRLRPLYLTGFLASPFRYLLPLPKVARLVEGVLLAVDSLLLRAAPALWRRAWFGVLTIRPSRKAPR